MNIIVRNMTISVPDKDRQPETEQSNMAWPETGHVRITLIAFSNHNFFFMLEFMLRLFSLWETLDEQ